MEPNHRFEQLKHDISRLRDHHKSLENLRQGDLDFIKQFSELGDPPSSAVPPKLQPGASAKLSNEDLRGLQEKTHAYYQAQIDRNNYSDKIAAVEETRRRQLARHRHINTAFSQQMRICPLQSDTRETSSPENQDQADQNSEDPSTEDGIRVDGDDASEQSVRGHSNRAPKTITVDEVFENGCAEEKKKIVEYPAASGCYYIIQCDLGPCEKKRFLVDRPLSAGSAHLSRTDHYEPVGKRKSAPFERVVQLLGTRVLGCTDELVSQNNLVWQQSRDEPATKNNMSGTSIQSETQKRKAIVSVSSRLYQPREPSSSWGRAYE